MENVLLRPPYPTKDVRLALDFGFLFGVVLLGLLKKTGRLEERFLSPFPVEEKGIIIIMNHPDGVIEWTWFYSKFFELRFLKDPSLYMKKLPFTIADNMNFRVLKPYRDLLILIDRNNGQEGTMISAIRRLKAVLDSGGNILLFGEGGRTSTRRPEDIIRSPIKGKPLGKINRVVGHVVKDRRVYFAWLECPGFRFSALPPRNSRGKSVFSWLRLGAWFLFTLLGLNGKIRVIWGNVVEFKRQTPEENARLIEQHLFALADRI